MRTANPDHLDQLAKFLDGRGGVQDKLDEAFTRASRLGVSEKLSTLKPMRSWVRETAPDLRKRAIFARLESGDPVAGLLWAGFSEKDLAKFKKEGLRPDQMLLANSVAASNDPNASTFKRKKDETLSEWMQRLEAHAVAKIPGLEPHEETIATVIGLVGDWGAVSAASAVVTVQGATLTKILVGNSLQKGAVRAWKIRVGSVLRGSKSGLIRNAGNGLVKWAPKIRSLSAPGSWLPGQLGNLLARSSTYQNITRVPLTAGVRGDLIGNGYNAARRMGFMRNLGANKAIDFIVGSDKIAARYGGLTHAGQVPGRAANASLLKVGGNIFSRARGLNFSRAASVGKAFAGAGKAAGLLRGAGVVGGVVSTGVSAANVIDQTIRAGGPVNAFKKRGAGYVADVAEVGFNASLTAAMVAPNPVTIGLAVGTGLIYGGAKVVEHWDDIKAGAGKAVDWTKDKAKDIGKGIADGAKSVAKKANPANWF
ncbi:PE-PGRS family protein [Streptomyces sp. SCSIO ZS0520]|uniref:PE-PGRS family protein n=1 Tax=Streptomyces sp. SCSIO ZS0520 TaxID=2892996 RepID=UPI0021D8C5B8|nr:PE-PGRS family protein [Streptomyces sp. SCSIO ZS0520]